MKEKRKWATYPVRVCYTLHHCAICKGNIKGGEEYFDGGYGKRAHVTCVPFRGGSNEQES